MKDVEIREAWILCFLLGVVMLNYPFIHIFNKPDLLFGIPALFLYFLMGWPLSILVIFLFSRTLRSKPQEQPGDESRPKEQG
jgi:hypothetical protein